MNSSTQVYYLEKIYDRKVKHFNQILYEIPTIVIVFNSS